MRTEVLVFWALVALCGALVCAQDTTEEKEVSRDPAQVRGALGPVARRRRGDGKEVEVPHDGELAAKVVPKPKKKTPEEIEAAKAKKAAEKEAKAKKQKAPKPTKKPKPPKPTKKPKPPKPTKKPKATKPTKAPKRTTTTAAAGVSQEEEEKRLLLELGLDTIFQPEEPVEPGLDKRRGGFPEVTTPEVIMYIPEETTPVSYSGPWYEEYDYTDLAAKKQQEEEERARKEKAEKAERLKKKWEEEEEERLRQTPVPPKPKNCPPLGLESHRVEDDHLLASSQSNPGFSAQRGRLNMQVQHATFSTEATKLVATSARLTYSVLS